MYDPIEITKLYVFGTNNPSPDDYNQHIRPSTATPASITYGMNDYMTSGGGRFAYPSLFGAIKKFFDTTIDDGTYTYAQIAGLLGLSDNDIRIGISQYGTSIGSADHAQRSYIFGSTSFTFDISKVTFKVTGGVKTINNLEVRAFNDNFDFDAGNPLAELINTIFLEPTLDPYGLGRGPVDINFTGLGKIYTDYSQSSFDSDKGQESEVSVIGTTSRLLKDVSGIASLPFSYFNNIASDPFLKFKRGDLKVIYGTPENDNLNEFKAELSFDVYFGYLMVGGTGNDTLNGGSFADELQGGEGNDVLNGGLGDDVFIGGAGDDTIDGGSFLFDGNDKSVYKGTPLDYDIRKNDDGSWSVRNVRGAKDEGSDTLTDIEIIQFDGDGGKTFKLAKNGLTFQTDFALVIDTTGSMGSSIGSVKAQATSLIDAVFAGGKNDGRIGVVGFKDTTIGEPSQIILPFTDQDDFAARKSEAIAAINSISVDGGGDLPETAFDGLRLALNGSMGKWRFGAGVLRVALFTDAAAKDGALAAEVTALAKSIGATITKSSSLVGLGGFVDTFSLTFGGDSLSRSGLAPIASDPTTATAEVQIFTIFTGPSGTDTTALSDIASSNGGAFLTAPTDDELVTKLLAIINAQAPTDLALSKTSIAENQPINSAIGNFTTTDLNTDDTFTYSLVTGVGDTDNNLFSLVGDELKAKPSFDFETKNSYSVRVKTTDKSGLSYEKPFTITVTDVNEAPTDLALSKTSIAENQPINSAIGNFTTTDLDTDDTFTYSLVTGVGDTDNNLFSLVGDELKAKPSFDFETKNSYSVRVKTTDKSGLSYEKPFTITVTDVNEAPTDILLTKQPASGNLPIGTILGNFSSTDPDTGNTFTYSLVNGLGNTSNSLFTIVGNKLKTNIPLDTNDPFNFSVRVRTTDQGDLFFDKIIEIKKISGGGWGDVHLQTFDGLWYDQQSFGDFILVKSTVDDWQIQTRQKPWIYNSNVSVNTAFATTVDGHRVLFDKFLDDDKKLKIDENQVTLTSGQSLNIGSSKISRQGNSYTLIYAGKDGILSTGDDDQLIAQDNGSYVDINVLPSNDRAGLLQGFLGNADGIISNDFTLRSGTLLSSNPTWEQIHGVWAESWRVLESESLFTTPPPSQGTPPKIILGDLDAKDVQDAKDIGIKLGLPDAALNAAALDFALTKDITFLNNAANLFSPKFSISSSSIAEGDKDSSSVRLFVQLSTSSKRTVTVDYATQDGTGLNKAIAGSDYTATSGTLTFLPGTTALTLDIPILGDTNLESDESFLVNLTNPYGAILTTSQSTINILNDDLTLVPTFAGISGNDIFTGGDANDIINGEGGDDSLNGGAGDDTLNGGSGKDVLTGGAGKDVFVYDNSTDSLFANPDRIRSFNPGEGDRLHLANNPTTIFNAGNISAANLTAAVTAAYADADPTAIGAQTLAANQAVFFSFGATSSTRRTYLSANDSNPGYNSGSDLFIEVTGIVGTLPSGSLASQSYFI
jgi:Ca2+-binding RTX toxin-like protein